MGKKQNAKQLHQTSTNKRKEKYENSTGRKLKTYHQMEEIKSSTSVNRLSFSLKPSQIRFKKLKQKPKPRYMLFIRKLIKIKVCRNVGNKCVGK